MRAILKSAIPLLCLSLALAACQGPVETLDNSTAPAVKFEGAVDSQFVGAWLTEDKQITYSFEKDGKYTMKGKRVTRQGAFDVNVSGDWLYSGDRMLFKDAQGNVVPYKATLSGKKLTLALTGTLKNETILYKK